MNLSREELTTIRKGDEARSRAIEAVQLAMRPHVAALAAMLPTVEAIGNVDRIESHLLRLAKRLADEQA